MRKLAILSSGATEFISGHTVNIRKEVDETMVQAIKSGAGLTKPVDYTFGDGYAGYFQDPDEHLWEAAWNPSWEINE
ncbi:MAG: VOC family protein [Thermodesulfovibrionales bacterium]